MEMSASGHRDKQLGLLFTTAIERNHGVSERSLAIGCAFFNLVEDGYFRKHFFSFIFQLNSNIFVLMFGNSFERTIVKDK
jgi:hypothetical protein